MAVPSLPHFLTEGNVHHPQDVNAIWAVELLLIFDGYGEFHVSMLDSAWHAPWGLLL